MNNRITIDVWDNGGKTVDRYSVAIVGLMEVQGEPWGFWLGASASPFSPQGFGLHGDEFPARGYQACRHRNLGKRIPFNALPADVQKFVADQFMPEKEAVGACPDGCLEVRGER